MEFGESSHGAKWRLVTTLLYLNTTRTISFFIGRVREMWVNSAHVRASECLLHTPGICSLPTPQKRHTATTSRSIELRK
jgi:hypothetical protein